MTTTGTRKPAPELPQYSDYLNWAGYGKQRPLLETFKEILPAVGRTLEIASGSGLYINYLAPHFPRLRFQPSDPHSAVFKSIRFNRRSQDNANVADPIPIDPRNLASWPDATGPRYDTIFIINTGRLAPLALADSIFALTRRLLADDGLLALFRAQPADNEGTGVAPARAYGELPPRQFPELGLRTLRDVEATARIYGLQLQRTITRGSHHQVLVFCRR